MTELLQAAYHNMTYKLHPTGKPQTWAHFKSSKYDTSELPPIPKKEDNLISQPLKKQLLSTFGWFKFIHNGFKCTAALILALERKTLQKTLTQTPDTWNIKTLSSHSQVTSCQHIFMCAGKLSCGLRWWLFFLHRVLCCLNSGN